MSKPTANWEKVGDKFYRKVQLYTAVFDQDLELDKYNVVGAPYSGAVGRYACVPPTTWSVFFLFFFVFSCSGVVVVG